MVNNYPSNYPLFMFMFMFRVSVLTFVICLGKITQASSGKALYSTGICLCPFVYKRNFDWLNIVKVKIFP